MESECIEHEGARNAYGYGVVKRDGRTHLAHRFAWEAEHGPVPPGLDLHHSCHNPACILPAHLEPRTRREHMQDHLRDACAHGHAYTPENTRHRPGRGRECKACAGEWQRAKRERRRLRER